MMHGREMSCHAASSCLIQRKHLTKRDPWKLLAFPASFPVSLPTRFPFFLSRAYPLSPEMLPNDLSSTLVHFHIFPSLIFLLSFTPPQSVQIVGVLIHNVATSTGRFLLVRCGRIFPCRRPKPPWMLGFSTRKLNFHPAKQKFAAECSSQTHTLYKT